MECFRHHLRWEERASIGYYRRPQNKSGYNQMNRWHLKWRIFNLYSFKFIVYKSSEIIQNMHYFKVLILVLTFVNVRKSWVKNQKVVNPLRYNTTLQSVTVLSLCFMALVFCSRDNSRVSAFSLRRDSKLSKSFPPSFLAAFPFLFFCKCRLRERRKQRNS